MVSNNKRMLEVSDTRSDEAPPSDHSPSPLLKPVSLFLKRSLDISIALPVVVFVLPALSIAVKVIQISQSPGPLLYRQSRSGRGSQEFQILKFRTMHQPRAAANLKLMALSEEFFRWEEF